MLVLAASEFGIGMTIDDTTVRLSSGPASCDLAGIDVTEIRTLRYSMCIDLKKKVRCVTLSDVLMFIFGRLGSISKLVFVDRSSKNIKTGVFSKIFKRFGGVSVFSKVFTTFSDVAELGFVNVSESSFREIVSALDLSSVRELDTFNIVLADDFSFIERLVSLEKLKMSVRGSTIVFLDLLSQIQSLRALDLRCNNLLDLLGLAFIAKMPSLEKLILSYCNLTSASLNTLSGIETHKSLRVLVLDGNNFSDSLDFGFVAKL